MQYGLIVIAMGIFMYIIGTVLYNYNLRKNGIDLSKVHDQIPKNNKIRKNKKVGAELLVMSTSLPGWMGLILFSSFPVIMIGVIMVLLSWVIQLFE
jgi:hypothetical protein